jgi:hypothetical protein
VALKPVVADRHAEAVEPLEVIFELHVEGVIGRSGGSCCEKPQRGRRFPRNSHYMFPKTTENRKTGDGMNPVSLHGELTQWPRIEEETI